MDTEEVTKLKSLFHYSNAYISKSTWRDMSLLKLCVCAVGVLVGCGVPKKYKKPVVVGSSIAFILSYIPLMKKFIDVVKSENEQSEAE